MSKALSFTDAMATDHAAVLARLVRDYLELEFQNAALPFPFSLEHVVDDFVLFCMLIGNDFLPCKSFFSALRL